MERSPEEESLKEPRGEQEPHSGSDLVEDTRKGGPSGLKGRRGTGRTGRAAALSAPGVATPPEGHAPRVTTPPEGQGQRSHSTKEITRRARRRRRRPRWDWEDWEGAGPPAGSPLVVTPGVASPLP